MGVQYDILAAGVVLLVLFVGVFVIDTILSIMKHDNDAN